MYLTFNIIVKVCDQNHAENNLCDNNSAKLSHASLAEPTQYKSLLEKNELLYLTKTADATFSR